MDTLRDKIRNSIEFTWNQKDALIDATSKFESGKILPKTYMTRASKVLRLDQWGKFTPLLANPELHCAFIGTKQYKLMISNSKAPPKINLVNLQLLNLPPQHLARFAATCRWTYVNISKKMLQEAVSRIKKLIEAPVKIIRKEKQNPTFEFASNDGDVIRIQVKHLESFGAKINSELWMAKTNNFIYARSSTFRGSTDMYKVPRFINSDIKQILDEIDKTDQKEDKSPADAFHIHAEITNRGGERIEAMVKIVNSRSKIWDNLLNQTPDDLEFECAVVFNKFPAI